MGIGYQESHILQRLARLPEDVFNDHIVSTLRNGDELTTASMLHLELVMKFKDRKAPPLPKGKFNVIYADPPYQYEYAHTHIKPISESTPP